MHGAHGRPDADPAHHAVLLAAHAWAHEPLACAGRLIDVSVMAPAGSRKTSSIAITLVAPFATIASSTSLR